MQLGLQLRPLFAELIETVLPPHLGDAATIEAGVRELEAVVLRIGVEAYQAEVQGLSYLQATGDLANFPVLHKMHVGIRDGLTTVLRGAALANTERLLAMPSPPVAEALLSALGRMSGMPEVPPVQAAAARFCLFQALRMNVMVAEMISDASIAEDGGLPRDLDAACEDEVRWWVVEGASQTGGVLPLRVLLVGALRSLRGRLDDVRVVVAQLGDEARADCERRKLIELMLRQMDAPDHLLLRNERFFAEDLGEQRLEMQRLLDNHPLAFSKMNRAAAYVRLQRLRKHLVHRQPIIRRGPALIDLLRAQEKGA